jgi:hypothetical protein
VAVSVGVNRLKGVSVGAGVFVGCGVDELVGSNVGEGVQVGGRMLRGVDVKVGMATGEGRVGGLKGLMAVFGLVNITRNAAITHTTLSNMMMVSAFHTKLMILWKGRSRL